MDDLVKKTFEEEGNQSKLDKNNNEDEINKNIMIEYNKINSNSVSKNHNYDILSKNS